jgi:hypothetical protein
MSWWTGKKAAKKLSPILTKSPNREMMVTRKIANWSGEILPVLIARYPLDRLLMAHELETHSCVRSRFQFRQALENGL